MTELVTRLFRESLWGNEIYRQTVYSVLGYLFAAGILFYIFRKKNFYFIYSWASIKSWLIVAPILFVLLGLPNPCPLIVFTLLGLYGIKVFFQLMGMYHRTYFVLICYVGVICLSIAISQDRLDLYNLIPMAVTGGILLVPLARNNFKQMIQYSALSILAFILLGWSFMHLGLILKLDLGIFQLMYLLILTEFCDNTNLAISRYLGKKKLFDRIDHRRTFLSTLTAILLTLLLAFAMRYLLPDQSRVYWLTSGLVAGIGGLFGDLIMTVIRRDAGIKIVSGFILGRGDFLHRMDRLIFVAPIYFYVMRTLQDLQLV